MSFAASCACQSNQGTDWINEARLKTTSEGRIEWITRVWWYRRGYGNNSEILVSGYERLPGIVLECPVRL